MAFRITFPDKYNLNVKALMNMNDEELTVDYFFERTLSSIFQPIEL